MNIDNKTACTEHESCAPVSHTEEHCHPRAGAVCTDCTEPNDNPDEDTLCDLAELFKIFGDSTRCKILYALSNGEMSVGDIADALSMTQSAISHQLRVLRSSRLVRFRRDGKAMLYALADDHVKTILEMGMEHIME
ncbi:MAG: helix-turn-helix transcriptional regulator [Clostridia bacterium]|nr:helix-turn-helix transcriptional regulator [Clostridia bacterium]